MREREQGQVIYQIGHSVVNDFGDEAEKQIVDLILSRQQESRYRW